MSKDRPFDPFANEAFYGDGNAVNSPSDDEGGPVLTFRRMTPPPGTESFSSVRKPGESEQLCQRCRQRTAVGGSLCFDCADIQNSLSKIASEIKAPQENTPNRFVDPVVDAANLRRQMPEGATPSPSELQRSTAKAAGSLFDELLEEVKQIQEPTPSFAPADASPRALGGYKVTRPPSRDVIPTVAKKQAEKKVEPEKGPIEGAAATLRHSPERPLARDLPLHRPAPSQYIQSGSQSPEEAIEKGSTKPRGAVGPAKPLSEGQAHDVDALLLDLIQVDDAPPPKPRSPLRIIFVTILVLGLLGAGVAAGLSYLQ